MLTIEKFAILFLSLTFLFGGCTAVDENVNDEIKEEETAQEVQVEQIEEVTIDERISEPVEQPAPQTYFYVQIGAFTTEDRAETFKSKAVKKIKESISISFDSPTGLWVLRVEPPFNDKKDADAYRNKLWQDKEFKDAFVVIIQK